MVGAKIVQESKFPTMDLLCILKIKTLYSIILKLVIIFIFFLIYFIIRINNICGQSLCWEHSIINYRSFGKILNIR